MTLNPNQMTAFAYRALVLAMAGVPEPAIEDATRALRLSPLDPANYQPQMALAISYIWLRQYDEAVAWAHKAIEGAPPRYPMSYAWLIVAEAARGGIAEAQRALERRRGVLGQVGEGDAWHAVRNFPRSAAHPFARNLARRRSGPRGIVGRNDVRPAATSPR